MEILGKYSGVTLQAHWGIDDFLRTQFLQHPEVAPHITLYILEHMDTWVEVSSLKQRVKDQDKTINKMEKICKELRARVDLLTEK